MATKKFKKLPKDSQRAAFAQMDEDGTRQGKGGKSGAIPVRKLRKQGEGIVAVKIAKYDAAHISVANTVHASMQQYNAASPSEKKALRDMVKADKARMKKEGMAGYYPSTTKARNDFLRLTKAKKASK